MSLPAPLCSNHKLCKNTRHVDQQGVLTVEPGGHLGSLMTQFAILYSLARQSDPLSLVELLHYCALIGPELQSLEIFSSTERSNYRRSYAFMFQNPWMPELVLYGIILLAQATL